MEEETLLGMLNEDHRGQQMMVRTGRVKDKLQEVSGKWIQGSIMSHLANWTLFISCRLAVDNLK